ncbi:unnamed protein product [Blepharisma stoltei]|uniref:Uncharacterized protein n=1 Tax=Blepharisma stoltei TaxID=1481888 RepID=A0AAU9JPE0_9CILI|nr:unnamed protein product [Blepharisma stoltei]
MSHQSISLGEPCHESIQDAISKKMPGIENLASYLNARKEFFAQGISLLRQQALLELSWSSEVQQMVRDPYHIVNRIADIMLFNEIEIAVWILLLESTSVAERLNNPFYVLIFTGFNAKQFINDDADIYRSFLRISIPTFDLNYHYWVMMTDSCEPSVIEINQKLSQIIATDPAPPEVNYNSLVDELCGVKKASELD